MVHGFAQMMVNSSKKSPGPGGTVMLAAFSDSAVPDEVAAASDAVVPDEVAAASDAVMLDELAAFSDAVMLDELAAAFSAARLALRRDSLQFFSSL